MAAAVGVNVVDVSNTASIINGADVYADGTVSVSALAEVDATTKALGSAVSLKGDSTNVAAAVGLNVVEAENRAFVASGSIVQGYGITIEAVTPGTERDDFIVWGASAGGGRGDAGIAGSVGINIIDISTEASARAGSVVNSTGAFKVDAETDLGIQTLAASAGFSTGDAGVGAAVAITLIDGVNDGPITTAYIAGTADATGALSVNAETDLVPLAIGEICGVDPGMDLTSTAVAGGATTGSAGIAAAATINIFDLTTTAYIADNAQINRGAASNGSVAVSATNTTTINSVTGSIGIGLDGAGVGAGLDLNIITKDTRAYIGSGADVDASNVQIQAISSENILSIAGNAGVGSDAGIAGSAAIQVINTGTRAYIAGTAVVDASGDVTISAGGTFTTKLIGGALGAASTAGVGAANTTLVHNDTVQAYIGNGAAVTSDGATGLSLSATSSEEVITIAASAGMAGTAGIAGSAAVTILDETTQAYIGQSATITATNGSVTLSATDNTTIVSVAGSLAAAGTAAVGIGADVATINKITEAFIDSGVTATVYDDIIIAATSGESITSVAAGLAASGTASIALDASVHILDIETRAFIGDKPDDGIATAGAGDVHAQGNILISADDISEIDKIVGVLAVSGTAGIGAAGAVTVIDKTTESFLGAGAKVTADGKWSDATVKTGSFTVIYDETALTYDPNDASGEGIQTDKMSAGTMGSASELGSQGEVKTPELSMSREEGGSNDMTEGSFSGQRMADVGIKTDFRGLSVTANNKDDIEVFTVSLAGGTVGVAISAGVNVVDTTTQAYIGASASVNTDPTGGPAQSVNVAAGNDFYHLAVAGTLAAGVVGVAPAVDVTILSNTTLASIGPSATVYAENDVTVQAHAQEDILLMGFGIAAGLVGVGGAVDVLTIDNMTYASIGAGSHVSAGGDVLVLSTDDTDLTQISGALAGGFVGVGASVGVVVINKDTQAFVDTGASVDALGNDTGLSSILSGTNDGDNFGTTTVHGLVVQAQSSEDIFHLAVAGGVGFVGVSGGISVTLIDSDTAAFIGANAQINQTDGNADANALQSVYVNASNDVRVMTFTGALAAGFVGVGGAVEVGSIKNDTSAKILGGADVTAELDVEVNALGIKQLDGLTISGAGGLVGLAASVSVWSIGEPIEKTYSDNEGNSSSAVSGDSGDADQDAANQAQNSQSETSNQLTNGFEGDTTGNANTSANRVNAATGTAGSRLSGAGKDSSAIMGAVNSAAETVGTEAAILGGATITAGRNIAVTANDNVEVDITVGGVAAGLVGIGAGISVLNIDANSSAHIAGTLSADGSISVNGVLVEDVDVMGLAGAAGFVGLGAAVVVIDDSSTVSAYLEGGSDILSATALSISASGNQTIEGETDQVAVGAVGAGASFVKINVGNDNSAVTETSAIIGSNTDIGQGSGTVGSVSVTANSTISAHAEANGLSAGIGAFMANFAFVDISSNTDASIGGGSHIEATGGVNVSSTFTPKAYAETWGVAAGGLAVGASLADADVTSTVTASATGVINAGSLTVSATHAVPSGSYNAKAETTSAGAGLVAVDATKSEASDTSIVRSSIGNGSILTIAGATNVTALNNTSQYADADSFAGGLVGVGISSSEATSNSTTEAFFGTNVKLTGNTLNISAVGTDENKAHTVSGSYGLVGVASASAETSTISTTTATINERTLYGRNITLSNGENGTFRLAAEHTAKPTANVESSAGGLFGGAGAEIDNTISSTVTANIGNNVQVTAKDITVEAINHVNNQAKIDGEAGGLISAGGGNIDTTIGLSTVVEIGDGADLEVVATAPLQGNMTLRALNDIVVNDKVILLAAGGLGSGISADAILNIQNDLAKVNINDAELTSAGEIRLSARGQGDIKNLVEAEAYGMGTVITGDSQAIIRPTNEIIVGTGADITAAGNILVSVGTDTDFTRDSYTLEVRHDSFAGSAIPMDDVDATGYLIQNNTINIESDAYLGSERNIKLHTERVGLISMDVQAKAVNWVSSLQDALNGAAAEFMIEGTAHAESHGIVQVDGTVETGLNRDKWLTLTDWDPGDEDTEATITAYDASPGVSFTVSTEKLESDLVMELNFAKNQLAMYKDSNASLRDYYTAEVARLEALLASEGLLTYSGIDIGANTLTTGTALVYHAVGGPTIGGLVEGHTYYAITQADDAATYGFNESDIIGLAASAADATAGRAVSLNPLGAGASHTLGAFTFSVSDLANPISVEQYVMTVTVDPIWAEAGSIDVRADALVGSVNFIAPSDASVTITNDTPAFLKILGITIPYSNGGLYLQGAEMTSNDAIDGIFQYNAALDNAVPNFGEICGHWQSGPVYTPPAPINFQSIPDTSLVDPEIKIENTLWDVSQDHDGDGQEEIYPWPDITIAGDIENLGGSVLLKAYPPGDGDIYVLANIRSKDLNVIAGGTFYVSGVTDYGIQCLDELRGLTTGQYPDAPGLYPFVVAADPVAVDTKLTTPPDEPTVYADKIFIDAEYVNLAGIIQSGRADYTLTLDDLITAEIAAINPAITSEVLLSPSMDDYADFTVTFDPVTDQIIVDEMRVSGGQVDITGHILNTGYGEIKILGGYADINIVNTTPYDLVLNRLDASQRGMGTLVLKDKSKDSASDLTATIYHYTGDGFTRTVDDGVTADVDYVSGNTDTYATANGWRYGWTVGVDATEYDYILYRTSAWLGIDALAADPGNIYSHDTEVTDLYLMDSGPYYYKDTGDATNYSFSSNTQTLSSSEREETDHWSETTWYGKTTYYVNTVQVNGLRTIFDHSVEADKPVNITFLGSKEGQLYVESNQDVILNGPVSNPSGTTTIISNDGSITQGSATAYVSGKRIVLEAEDGIGEDTSGLSSLIQGLLDNDGNGADSTIRTNLSDGPTYQYTTGSSGTADTPGFDLAQGENGAYYTPPVMITIAKGDRVKLANDYDNGGTAGAVYEYVSATPAKLDLGIQNYNDGSKWALVVHRPSLEATTVNGSIVISETVGDLYIDQVAVSSTTDGNVNLTAQGGMYVGQDSAGTFYEGLVQGGTITLNGGGNIGTNTHPLQFESGAELMDYVSVMAGGNVYFDEKSDDLHLKQVIAGGDVGIGVVDGDLIDVNQAEERDERTVEQLRAGVWADLGLTGAGAEAKIVSLIESFEATKTGEYKTYWTYRNQQSDDYVGGLTHAETYYVVNDFVAFESTAVSGANDTIVLAANHGLSDGDLVIYWQGNSTTGISGLVDGTTYEVMVDDTDPNLIQLQDTSTHDVIELDASESTLRGYRLEILDSDRIKLAASYDNATAVEPLIIDLTASLTSGAIHGFYDGSVLVASFGSTTDVDGILETINLAGHTLVNGDALTYYRSVAYDAEQTVTLSDTEKAAYTDFYIAQGKTEGEIATAIAAIEYNRTLQYRALHEDFGGADYYDPDFTYNASPSEEDVIRDSVKVWTEEELLYAVGAGLLKPVSDTTISFEDPNIVGVNVTIEALAGGVGNATGYEVIDLSTPSLTDDQRIAFAAAERDDIAYMGAPITVTASFSGTTNTITRTSGSWITDGFKAGMSLEISDSSFNNTAGAELYEIASVTANTITIKNGTIVKTEAANSIKITPEILTPTVFTTVDFADSGSADTITRTDGKSWIDAGFVSGMKIRVVGATANANDTGEYYTIAGVTASTITLTGAASLINEVDMDVTVTPEIKKIIINQREDVDVSASGDIVIEALNDVYLGSGKYEGSTYDLRLDSVKADGTIRIKGDQAIINSAGSSATNVEGGSLILEAAAGPIGGSTAATKLYINLDTGSTLTARALNDIYIVERDGDMNLETIFSEMGGAYLQAQGSIVDALNTDFTNIQANDLVLTATTGTIGESGDYLEVDAAFAGTLIANAQGSIWLYEASGDMNVKQVKSNTGDVDLKADQFIKDKLNLPAAEIVGKNIRLTAERGGIGVSGNEVDIDSDYNWSSGPHGTLTSSSTLNNTYIIEPLGNLYLYEVGAGGAYTTFITAPMGSILNGRPDDGSNVTSGNTYLIAGYDIGAEAKWIHSTVGNLEGKSIDGSTWILNSGALTEGGVPETGTPGIESGDDIMVTAESPITVHENIVAEGDITLKAKEKAAAGDDITIEAGRLIRSTDGGDITFYAGDNFLLDAGALIQTTGKVTIYMDYGSLDPNGGIVTIYGTITASDLDIIGAGDKDYIYNYGTINLENVVNIYGEETADEITLNSNIFAQEINIYGRGGDDTILLTGNIGAEEIRIYGDTGDDLITISIADGNQLTGHVSVFGNAGEDQIVVNRLHTRNDVLDLDGGADRDLYYIYTRGDDTDQLTRAYDTGASGVDEMTMYGTSEDDVFLLRAMALPDQTTPDTGFVAKLNQDGADVERFNYRGIEGITLNTLYGNDYVASDDALVVFTINGGVGDDTFQIGQVFKSQRTTDDATANIASDDVFATIEITRGWLSNGISTPMTINGGEGNDEFTVFHNKAVLTLYGGDGDDSFTVRSFALAGSQDSQRARTDMKGDAGVDTIRYAVNAPVGIDGGDGFDMVTVIGTEFSDDYVITDQGVFGAGLYVTYVNIEKLRVDGAEGDDRYFVLSTNAEMVTEIDGGLGSDSFFVGGSPSDAPIPVISNDLQGHSGVILHNVESGDLLYDGIPVDRISANVADNDESFIVVKESGGVSAVTEDIPAVTAGLNVEGWDYDTYTVALTRAPQSDEEITISVLSQQPSPENEAKGYQTIEFWDPNTSTWQETLQLAFNAGNWQTAQTVKFRAISDTASEGKQFALINHKVESSDTNSQYHMMAMRSVKVQVNDDDRAGAIITPTGRTTQVIEGGMTDEYAVVLTRQPSADVTVTLDPYFSQLMLSSESLTFTPDNYNLAQTITITALDDTLKEGFHTDYIYHSMTSLDVDQTVAQASYQLDGDPAVVGVQDIPAAKPLDTLLLRNKPIEGTVQVEVNDVLREASRFVVIGNTLVFLNASGTPEAVSGKVEVGYSYVEPGYEGKIADRLVVDIADNEVASVVVIESDGSTDVMEGGITDTYQVVLTKAPTEDVTINIDAIKTRTTGSDTDGNFAFFEEQVLVNGMSATTLTFTTDDWNIAQTVTVSAIDDTRIDGSDTQVFVPGIASVNKIRGPLFIEGAAGEGSLSLPAPLMLLGELNIRPTDGNVVSFTSGTGYGAIEQMTVETADLAAVVTKLGLASASDLIGKTLEMTKGSGTGVVLNPEKPDQFFDRFWMIVGVEADGDNMVLTLRNPSQVDPGDGAVAAPDATSEYAITSLSINFFADEREQVDYLFVYDQDSVADDVGQMTSQVFGEGDDAVIKGRITGLGMGPDAAIGGTTQPGGITYGDLEVVQVNLGSGNDNLTIDYTTIATDHTTERTEPFYTLTLVNTGEGDDIVTVNLTEGEDGAFSLNTQAGNDIVYGEGSTLPLIVFGGTGNDEIYGGSGNDILFGDIGRVDYVNADGFVVTRLGHTWEQNPVNPPISSATSATLTDAAASFTTTYQGLAGLSVQVISPAGFVQYRTIVSNTADTITVDSAWDEVPDSTYFYRVSMLPENQTDGIVRGPSVVWSINEAAGGNDTIDGGVGADMITGGASTDTVSGGDGDDLIAGDNARFDFTPVSGNDGLTVLALAQTTSPSIGDVDTLYGDAGNDTIFGGQAGDDINAGDGNNIVLGDDGKIDYVTADGNPADIDLLESLSTDYAGGVDTITTGEGNDIVIGGRYGDIINANAGDNLVIGDSGRITAASADGAQFGVAMTYGLIETVAFGDGGVDTITTLGGHDIVLGGQAGDDINAGDGNNIVLGDDGKIDYVTADGNPADIDLIESLSTDYAGGVDTITTGEGNDIVIGGRYGDIINANAGDNLVIGDSGRITAASADGAQFGVAMTYGLIETVAFGDGGVDTITTLGGHDIVLGGQAGDDINAGDGNNIVLGDDGKIDYVTADGNPADIDLIESLSTDYAGGVDTITTGEGNDIVIGGRYGDIINANAGDNLVIGDSGRITAEDTTPKWPGQLMSMGKIETIEPDDGGEDTITTLGGSDIILGGTMKDTIHAGDGVDVVFGDQGEVKTASGGNYVVTYGVEPEPWFEGYYFIATTIHDALAGTGDVIYGEGGRDYILGQQGSDVIFGGAGDDDIYGGHNVATGYDTGDTIDGGTGNDVIAGDNASIQGTDDYLNPRFRALAGTVIYDSNGVAQETADFQRDPNQIHVRTVELYDSSHDPDNKTFGNDLIAGGADDDVIFGQLGNDTLHGDGWISDSAYSLASLTTTDTGSDIGGDDYVEGNGGNDTIYGGLGQDDLIGGNSTLFGLNLYDERPDGSDMIYGGNGDMLARNNMGDLTADGHARDADMILGDNGNIYRLVGTNGSGTGQYLTFNYDNYSTMKIIPRAARLLDYTPGGPDYDPTAAAADIGAADIIHGESGDDFIYGMIGNDVLYGEGQDDDLIGGYGNDWISGGTGDDGVLGDDGRIYTSRNSTAGEPLYGIVGLTERDPDARFNNGTVLNEFIYTPGKIQQMTINVAGELKKSVNLTPFNLDPLGAQGGIENPLFDPQYADDIIYGGWGNDSLHGGAGDDAISGAEALQVFYDNPGNPGDVLGYGDAKIGGDNTSAKAGEFAWYDEYNPLVKIEGFLLNFDATEGPNATGTKTDGNDAIFGDLGNDWIVGGTGRDHLYGGWGDDLLNADDNLETAGGLNNTFDTDATYEDLAYGGAGRDVLIANTGGDRLIDWAGEFNSYIVPFAPFGMATVSRTIQPQLPEYLYALSMSDGVDMTRAADTGNDAVRNGEPDGELGLVKQRDAAWQDQTGAPDDPQAGNIAGGRRDVLRSASFNTGNAENFAVDSGLWTVESGRYQVTPEYLGGDALAVFNVDKYIPNYFEMTATISAVKPIAGYKANAYMVFDYQSATDFKFAGINVSNSQLEIGYRDATGWHVVLQKPYTGSLKVDTDYNLLLALNGSTATLVVQNKITLTHTFATRVDADGFEYFLNEGMVGIGANNAKAQIDNVVVQRIAPETTRERTVAFSEDLADQAVFSEIFSAPPAGWSINEGRYVGENSVNLANLSIDPAYLVELSASLKTGAQSGFVFDYYGPQDYKFVAVSVETGQVMIGHSTAKAAGWVVDAVWSNPELSAESDYSLGATLIGNTVSVTFNNQGVLSFAFNALVTDGQFGLLAHNGAASFDTFTFRTDDPSLAENITPVFLPTISVSDVSVKEGDSGAQEGMLTFTLSAASTEPVTIDYATLDGTALVNMDYQSATGTLIFASGETEKQVTFYVAGDEVGEADETFSVQLSNPVGAAISDGVGTITIVNDDAGTVLPSISIGDVSVQEGDRTNKTKATVTVTLSQASATPVSVSLATENGTAVSGSDYVTAGTTITFAAGETTKQYTLTVNGDKIGEADEWFGVRLSGAIGATVADDFGRISILNDDGYPMVAADAAPIGDAAIEILTDEIPAQIVDAAIDRWTEAIAIDETTVAALQAVNFQIADFTGLTLGITDQNTIFIDTDAAGYGWFVDQTPWDDVEFAQADSAVAGRMDLLTVVMHELGHVLGYRDIAVAVDNLMNKELAAGIRYLPADLSYATVPSFPTSTLLNFPPPSNGIPVGWIFENGSVAEGTDVESWWSRLRNRITGHSNAHDVLPMLLNIREMASTGSMENDSDSEGEIISMVASDKTVGNGIAGESLGQGQPLWVTDFVLNKAEKNGPNNGIKILI